MRAKLALYVLTVLTCLLGTNTLFASHSEFVLPITESLTFKNEVPGVIACLTFHGMDNCNCFDKHPQQCCKCSGCKCPESTEVVRVAGKETMQFTFKKPCPVLFSLFKIYSGNQNLTFDVEAEDDVHTAKSLLATIKQVSTVDGTELIISLRAQ